MSWRWRSAFTSGGKGQRRQLEEQRRTTSSFQPWMRRICIRQCIKNILQSHQVRWGFAENLDRGFPFPFCRGTRLECMGNVLAI